MILPCAARCRIASPSADFVTLAGNHAQPPLADCAQGKKKASKASQGLKHRAASELAPSELAPSDGCACELPCCSSAHAHRSSASQQQTLHLQQFQGLEAASMFAPSPCDTGNNSAAHVPILDWTPPSSPAFSLHFLGVPVYAEGPELEAFRDPSPFAEGYRAIAGTDAYNSLYEQQVSTRQTSNHDLTFSLAC